MLHRRCVLSMIMLMLASLLVLSASPMTNAQEAVRNPAFGLNSHTASRLPQFDFIGVAVDTVAQTGVGWVREDFQWSRIEPDPGEFNWQFHDDMVARYQAAGINIVGLLNGPTPAWASGADADSFAAPDPQGFANFVRIVVDRYRDQITHWQVWNEPDNELYWQPVPNIPAYANLLMVTSQAIRETNPNARVLSAGMVAPHPAEGALTTIAEAGAWGAFDIIAIHPYTDPLTPEAGNIVSSIQKIQALANRFGAKPLWATELGFATANGRGGSAFSGEQQANYLVRAMVQAHAAGVERVFWYKLKDNADLQDYGLIAMGAGDTDYAAFKPGFFALQTLTAQLAPTSGATLADLGQRATVLDFEQFGTWTRGDQPNGNFYQSGDQQHTGAFSARLDYSFPSPGNDYVVFNAGAPPVIAPGASQFGVWLFGDNSGHDVKVWLRDSQGEVLQFSLGGVGAPGWNFLSAPINNPVEPWNVIFNGNNRLLDLPASLVSIVLDDSNDAWQGTGTIYLDDFTAVSGPEAYRVRSFLPDGQVVDVLWATQDGGGTVPVATQSSPATQVDRSGGVSFPVPVNGVFNFPLGESPIYLTHVPGN